MAVIPGSTILQHGKVVRPRGTSSDRTLRQGYAILVVAIVLTKTVPVNDSTFVVEAIGDMDDDCVAPTGLNQGSGVGAIEETSLSRVSIRRNRMLGNVEIVLRWLSDASLCAATEIGLDVRVFGFQQVHSCRLLRWRSKGRRVSIKPRQSEMKNQV